MHRNQRLPCSSGLEEAQCEFQLSSLCRVILHMLSLSDQDHGCVQETLGAREPTVESHLGLHILRPQRHICAMELAPMAEPSGVSPKPGVNHGSHCSQ